MMRMEQCKAEPCIFRKTINNKVSLMVGAYVDDINSVWRTGYV